MKNEFEIWSSIKQSVEFNFNKNIFYPKEGEVWMCILGKNIGSEQNGGGNDFTRPVVILKKFNNKIYWIIPLSTKQKNLDYYYNFTDLEHKNISAIIAQLRLVSIKRFKRKMYQMHDHDFLKIKQMIVGTIP